MSPPYNFHPLAAPDLLNGSTYDAVMSSPDTPDRDVLHSSPNVKAAQHRQMLHLGQHQSPSSLSLRSHEAVATDYLIIVILSSKLVLLLSRLGQQGLDRGFLVNLYPTLAGQLAAIARHLHLPATNGMMVYINEVYSLSANDSHFSQLLGPRVSEDAWPILWAAKLDAQHDLIGDDGLQGPEFSAPPVPPIPTSFLMERLPDDSSSEEAQNTSGDAVSLPLHNISAASVFSTRSKRSPAMTRSSSAASTRHLPSMSFSSGSQTNRSLSSLSMHSVKPPSSGVIAGKIELDVDQRGEKWLDEWISKRTKFASRGVLSIIPSASSLQLLNKEDISEDPVSVDGSPTAVLPRRGDENEIMSGNSPTDDTAHHGHAVSRNQAEHQSDYVQLTDTSEPEDIGIDRSVLRKDPLADVFGPDERQWSGNPNGSEVNESNLQEVNVSSGTPLSPHSGTAVRNNGDDDIREINDMLRETRSQQMSLSSPVPVASPRFHSEFEAALEAPEADRKTSPERSEAEHAKTINVENHEDTAISVKSESESAVASNVDWAQAVANTFAGFTLRRKMTTSDTVPESQTSFETAAVSGSQRSSVLLQRTLDDADAAIADLATHIKSPSPPTSSRLPRTAMFHSLNLRSALASSNPSSPQMALSDQLSQRNSPILPTKHIELEMRGGTKAEGAHEVSQDTDGDDPLKPPQPSFLKSASSRDQSPVRSQSSAATSSPARTSSLAASQSPLMASTAVIPPLPTSSPDAQTPRFTTEASGHAVSVEDAVSADRAQGALNMSGTSEIRRPESAMTTKTSLAYLSAGSPPMPSPSPTFTEFETAAPLPREEEKRLGDSVSQPSEADSPHVNRSVDDHQKLPATSKIAGSLRAKKPFPGMKVDSPSLRSDTEPQASSRIGTIPTPTKLSFSFKSLFAKKDTSGSPILSQADTVYSPPGNMSPSFPTTTTLIHARAADEPLKKSTGLSPDGTVVPPADRVLPRSASPSVGTSDLSDRSMRSGSPIESSLAYTSMSRSPSHALATHSAPSEGFPAPPDLMTQSSGAKVTESITNLAAAVNTPVLRMASSMRQTPETHISPRPPFGLPHASNAGMLPIGRSPMKEMRTNRQVAVNDDLDEIMAQLADLQDSDVFKKASPDSAQPGKDSLADETATSSSQMHPSASNGSQWSRLAPSVPLLESKESTSSLPSSTSSSRLRNVGNDDQDSQSRDATPLPPRKSSIAPVVRDEISDGDESLYSSDERSLL